MKTTLFERLGGTDGIHALVEDIVTRHLNNPVISARFRPYLDTPNKLAVTKDHLCAFLSAGSGGPNAYQGRDMRSAHRGMNISAAEYMAAVDDILASMRHRGIDEATRGEVLGIAYSLKDDIMHL